MVVIFATIFFISKNAFSFESIVNQHGIWIVRHNLKSKASIDRVIANLENLKIEHAYLQIRGRGYTYYNSQIEPKAPGIDKNFDPLHYFIESALEKNIKVHAWINTYLLWTNRSDPTNNNHLYFKHPDWFEVNRKSQNDNSVRQIYLSPHVMRVNLYLLSIVEEVIDRYRVDGIHLDYVRYYNENSGYHPVGLQDFQKIKNDEKDSFDHTDEWIEYKSRKVDELILDISELIKIQSRQICFSAAVKPNPFRAYYSYGQNWVKWLNSNWIDHVVLMNYADNVQVFTENLSLVQMDCEIDKVFCGIGLWNKPKEIIVDQLIESKKMGFHKFVLFSYDTVINNNWIH